MLRKDYELIAGTLRRQAAILGSEIEAGRLDRPTGTVRIAEIRRTAEAFADALAGTNPRFDRERFLAAATYWPETP